jgi:serine/threonine protein kinase
MFASSNMDSLKCPITCELFRDPVTGQDGHTYERDDITVWLNKNGTSPITREPMSIESLRPNHTVKQLIDEFKMSSSQKHFLFKLNIDIKKTEKRPIFQAPGKTIYKAEWIAKPGPPIVLLKIEGAKANQEASFYVPLGSHPHIVHTYGMVENDSNSLMLIQEYATEGDLAELLRENEFQPSQSVLLEIFLQIIDAMISLANFGIVHGDLACRNVLVFRFNPSKPEENLVKLTDFGLTRASKLYSVVGSTASTTLAVVPLRYAAPEILRSAGASNYSEKSDVYSMGVLMWEACSQGQLPYALIEDDNDVRRRKLNGETLTKPDICDDALWNIIVSCWRQQSEVRPTFKMLKQSLLYLQLRSAARYAHKEFRSCLFY